MDASACHTISRALVNVPQSHGKLLGLISELTERICVLFRGKDKSCIMRNSLVVFVFSTVPKGDVRKGPIKDSRRDLEKGPEYL